MECAYCGKKIGVLRKLKHAEFCSVVHQKAYMKKQEALALDFLMENKKRPTHKVSQVPPVETALAVPEPPKSQPLPSAAEFAVERAAPARLEASVERIAQPRNLQPQPVLPAARGLSPARLSGFGGLTAAADSSPAQGHAAGRGELPFATERPHIPDASIAPLWIAPASQAPAERPQAGFARLVPRWAPRQAGEVLTAAVFRPMMATCMGGEALAPHAPSLGPGRAVPCSLEMSRGLASHLGNTGAIWNRARMPTFELRAPLALGKNGISCSQETALSRPRSKPAPPAAVQSAAGRSMGVANPELRPAMSLAAGSCSLACAEPAAIATPRVMPAKTSTAIATAPLVWRRQIRLGPHHRLGPIRPNFEVPATEEPRHEDPIRGLDPVTRVPWAVRLTHVSQAMPGWSRRLAVLVLVAVAAWAGSGGLRHSVALQSAEEEMWARISRRAAVEIQDDFRSGLSQWRGGPEWATSWSYDGTGFARPGRLALLSSSLPLGDYRLEFTAQIERKAVAWVFRAADRNNYYATKLVESTRGAATAFLIVRYAVIDGRERFKAELPLPVTPSARTLLRVRQEIRGAQFTTYLDGVIIDTWTDSSLVGGGVGFFADAGESAYIRSIHVAQNDDFMGRLCSYLASAHGG